jgi:hypothetical protein
VDAHWTLASVDPDSGIPQGLDIPNAYITQDSGQFPFDHYWLHNDATSKWITYSSPLYTGGDITRSFDYRLTFWTSGGSDPIRWLSDNSSALYLDKGTANEVLIGTRGMPLDTSDYSPFNSWNIPLMVNLTAGEHTLDLIILNIGQDSSNPTGARVEFSAPSVPEASTFISGVLLLLPFGASAMRILRKRS